MREMVNMIDLEQYYTTPAYLAIRMAKLIPESAKSILEPSAGEGALIKALKKVRDNINVWYCEINESRRNSLRRSDGIQFGGDFLMCEPKSHQKTFDAVIMNPPFRNAEEHFLRAYGLLRQGGTMVCLVSAETLSGKTKKESLLLNIIAEHNGSVETIEGAFSQKTALRKSNVKCSLIHFKKGESEDSFDFRDEMEDEEKLEVSLLSSDEESELQIYNYLDTMVNNYNRSIERFNEFNRKYYELSEVFPQDVDRKIIPTVCSEGHFLAGLRSSCWAAVFKKTQLANYMTTDMMKDFEEQQEKEKAKEFTMQNIASLLSTLKRSLNLITDAAIKNVFNWMTRYHKDNRLHIEGWKTNSAWKVNRKVILPNILEYPSMREHPKYICNRSRERLADIEKALCLMTGKRFDDISSNFHTPTIAIPFEWIKEDQFGVWHDSYFFKVKIFKKRTMHIVFKDDEIWEMFNARVCQGQMWIGDNGRDDPPQ